MIARRTRAAVQKFMKKLEAKKGPFTLFGLFLRENAPGGVWHLVVAAPWLERGGEKAHREYLQAVADEFGKEWWRLFSCIAPLDHDSPFLLAVLDEVGTVRRTLEKVGPDLFGMEVEAAYIFTARRLRIPAQHAKLARSPRSTRAISRHGTAN